MENQLQAVEGILQQLKLEEKPRIYVFNKIDRLEELPPIVSRLEKESCCYISAAEKRNLDVLLNCMEGKLVQNVNCRIQLPHTEGKLLNQAYDTGVVSELEYTEHEICFTWSGRRETMPRALEQYQMKTEV